MPNYSEGKIYKIIAETTEDFLPYVGSSTQKLSKRMSQHRDNYKLFLEGKDRIRSKACDLFQKFGVKNCRIVLIENFPCKTIEELVCRERYWYDNIKNCNAQKPQRTIEELVNYIKEYCAKNKEKKKEYNQKNKEQIAERSKEYYQTHKEQIAEKDKIYYDKYKELILEKRKKTYECPCGSICCKSHKTRHEKTIKHISFISQK